ncbi:double-stranded RNA-binding protein 4-like isoform X2 [Herrania umbratica]|uniref:Double-stranded RNA-binding protein 4-like isoform X2 n=1 Tax=Herrania umbratica TaxID=108875 RepID=A0A6J1A4V6_9ROSI|nr:double-stranded RNA-binding protein 4-like isoform X2 [Herrania umbratica]
MYKSKLQELCQKKAWELPEYDTTKQGQDHNPRFEAAVVVNGMSFQSQNLVRSAKEAQNDAARVAFLYFTSPPLPNPGSSNVTANFDSNTENRRTVQPGRQETNRYSQVNETGSVCKDNHRVKDIQHLYKNLLQVFAQKRNLDLPVYSCEFEGPPHASRFRCKVTFNEQTYESLEFFPTIKEAEHAAAKIALSSLSPDAFQEEDFSFYKNLLQELTQKEGCPLPVYTTTRSGEAHASTFVSIVEVKGNVFTGQEAKTKKQAEVLAAKVAYMKLKECKSNRGSMIINPAYQERQVPVLSVSHSHSNVNADTQQNFGPKACTVFSPSSTTGKDQHEDRVHGTFRNHLLSIPFPQPEMTTDWQSSSSTSSMYDPLLPEDDLSMSNWPSNHSATTNSDTNSITMEPVAMGNLPCNRVVVLPRAPNLKFPAGWTLLPMSDENWVAFKFESQPNQ